MPITLRGGQMKRRNYLAALFLGFVVLGLVSPAVSAGIPGSVTLKIQKKVWWAEAHVYTTIFYNVESNPYGFVEFAPLGAPYNYIHFGSHSGTASNAYWKSVTASTSALKHYASGWWHVEALGSSRDGTMQMWLYIEYQDSLNQGDKELNVDYIGGTPYLMVRYTVDSSGGSELANKAYDIAIGAIKDYLVSA